MPNTTFINNDNKRVIKVVVDIYSLPNYLKAFHYLSKSVCNDFPVYVTVPLPEETVVIALSPLNNYLKPGRPVITDGNIYIYANRSKDNVPDNVYKIDQSTFDKNEQMQRINKVHEKNAYSTFVPITSWRGDSFKDSDVSGYVLIKPSQGADSVDHFVVDSDKQSVLGVIETFNKHGNDSTYILNYLYKNIKTINYHGGLSIGSDLDILRSFRYLENSTLKDFTVQCIVTDIEEEYRVVLDRESKVWFAYQRVRHEHTHPGLRARMDSNYLQGHGNLLDSDVLEEMTLEEVFSGRRDSMTDFMSLATEAIGPFGCIDIFIRKDKKWGICEYSPHFGFGHKYPEDRLFKYHMSFIIQEVRKYLALTA